MNGYTSTVDTRLTWPLRLLLWLESWSMPLWRRMLERRRAAGKETLQSVQEKLMEDIVPRQSRGLAEMPLIWGHAVGVGEALALMGLFKRLSSALPDCQFLLTSSSRTSGEALAKQGLPDRFHHRFSPVDHPEVLRKFLDHWNPAIACWSETDLWPGMVTQTAQRGIPMFMFNARLDSGKAKRIKSWGWFFGPLLGRFMRIYAQSQSSAAYLAAAGYGSLIAPSVGDIKSLAPALPVDASQYQGWRWRLDSRPVWLLASSHEGEEELALQAHQALLLHYPQALLVIVPRDAFRGTAVARLAQTKGLNVAQRSAGQEAADSQQVYVADTMGELGLWYRLASVAMIGGSLVPIGGHNPYEALVVGCKVLSGPWVHNFSDSYEELITLGLASMVRDAKELAEAVAPCWHPEAARTQGLESAAPIALGPISDLLDDILSNLRSCLAFHTPEYENDT